VEPGARPSVIWAVYIALAPPAGIEVEAGQLEQLDKPRRHAGDGEPRVRVQARTTQVRASISQWLIPNSFGLVSGWRGVPSGSCTVDLFRHMQQ
jgi:hypothetical protein